MSAVLFILSTLELLSLHFTLIAGLLAMLSGVILVGVSLATDPASEEQLARFTFNAADAAPSKAVRWWQDYRLQSAALLVLAVATVVAHW